jgi:hypothetical protein
MAVLMLSGCADWEKPANVQPSDFYGTWQSHGLGQDTTTLEFAADGTFEWSLVPRGVFDEWPSSQKLDWDNRMTYAGNWTVEPDFQYPDEYVIQLTPERPPGARRFVLLLAGNGTGRSLFYSLGDPDLADRMTFSR